MVPEKNLEFAVQLCQALAARGYRFRYTIVGTGPGRAELERLIQASQLEEQVILAGSVSQEDLVAMYHAADVFVLTSKSEGIPVSAMEAMSCGLCVVAPRITGIPELVEDGRTGLLFGAGDLQDAVQILGRLMDDPELRIQMGQLGRKTVLKNFKVETNVKQLAKLLVSGEDTRDEV
jgi:glycosyltransferase involved in cell wall biosynthesis